MDVPALNRIRMLYTQGVLLAFVVAVGILPLLHSPAYHAPCCLRGNISTGRQLVLSGKAGITGSHIVSKHARVCLACQWGLNSYTYQFSAGVSVHQCTPEFGVTPQSDSIHGRLAAYRPQPRAPPFIVC